LSLEVVLIVFNQVFKGHSVIQYVKVLELL
jgi:hypothetical protein